MDSQLRKNSSGQATLMIVSVFCVVGIILLMISLDTFVRDYNYKAKDFNQVLLDETTSSAFAIMEAALERRLWEPPPDADCLRSEKVIVKGTLPDGVEYEVIAKFNPKTRNFEMVSKGKYRTLTSEFRKKIKVMDLSDYLVLSTNSKEVLLDRGTSKNAPAALIARDRRIYTQGPLIISTSIDRGPSSRNRTNFNGTPAIFPQEWGTIIQGDRMQFAGGIRYQNVNAFTPDPGPMRGLLAPYSRPYGSTMSHYGQAGAGSAVITKDYNKAMNLRADVSDGSATRVTKGQLRNEVYPAAYGSGALPIQAWTSADSGAYLNDPDHYAMFFYEYAGVNNFNTHYNASCFSRADFVSTKQCSNSEDFPRGFSQWRKDAGLEGYLFTSDAVAVPAPTFSWENLAALEKDAELCGAVISAPIDPYVDCPIWDANFLMQYRTGNVSGCQRTSKIDLDTLTLNNMNVAALNNPANVDRLLRRVIYVKGPAEFVQNNPQGLMTTTVTTNSARKNLSIWLVTEDMMALRGHQSDTTSPLDERPGEFREVVFNDDDTGATGTAKKAPLQLTILSTERVHLLSPDYVPMSVSHLQTIWPTSGGVIRPERHSFTDWDRQENDGFKYGLRRFRVEGVSLITNSSADQPFYLRGLWSGRDSTATQSPSNQCMVSLAGHTLDKRPGHVLKDYAMRPAYAGTSVSNVPPPSSRFWNNQNYFSSHYIPAVFNVQYAANPGEQRLQSEVILSGITMATTFSSTFPTGKKRLDIPSYSVIDGRNASMPFDLSHKNYGWDVDWAYNQVPVGTVCNMTNLKYADGSADFASDQPSVNSGMQTFVQASPDADYRNVGSVLGVDQLIIESKAKE